MCFGGPDTSAMDAALAKQAEMQERALELQEQATMQAKAAMKPPEDSEEARVAAEDRLRKLLEGGAMTGKRELGAAPVGYRMLMGS